MAKKTAGNRIGAELKFAVIFDAAIVPFIMLLLIIGFIPSAGKKVSIPALVFIFFILLTTAAMNIVLLCSVRRKLQNPLGVAKFIIETPCRDLLKDHGSINDVDSLVDVFAEMAAALDENKNTMHEQNRELQDKNWELQEANLELEASQSQLQAIIDQLNESEQQYHSLVKNIPDVVLVVDAGGTISFINHICIKVLGYEKSELKGTCFLDLIDAIKSPLSLDEITRLLELQNAFNVELSINKKNSTSILVEATFTNYMVNTDKMGLQIILRDITQKRSMEEEIVRKNRELAILNVISKSLTSTLDMDELLHLIVNEITNVLNYPACLVGLSTANMGVLQVKAFSGLFFSNVNDPDDFVVTSLKDEIIEKACENAFIVDATALPDEMLIKSINNSKPNEEKLGKLLFAPLQLKQETLGILVVGTHLCFKPEEVNLLTSICNNAAVAVNNAILYDVSKNYFIKTIDTLIAAIEAKDKYTEGHSQRVSKYATHIAKNLKLSREQIEDIRVAGILHDIGKIGISDSILSKPGKLTREEYEVIMQHPAISNKILYPIGFSERTLKAIAFHHERYDGNGYPFKLAGEDISIEAQIISVADAYDAMTSNRPYRPALSKEQAICELSNNKTTQFSPKIVDAFVELLNRQSMLNRDIS